MPCIIEGRYLSSDRVTELKREKNMRQNNAELFQTSFPNLTTDFHSPGPLAISASRNIGVGKEL